MKTYTELITLPTFSERLEYLRIAQKTCLETFGDNRYLNQLLYHDPEWRRIRNYVISRDRGCDLGILDLPLNSRVYIHHINPITEQDILQRAAKIFDLENLISCSFDTHQMIHYGIPPKTLIPIERKPNDTCPWR